MKYLFIYVISLAIISLTCCGKKKFNQPESTQTKLVDSIIKEINKSKATQKKRAPHINWNTKCNGTFQNKSGILKIWNYKPSNDTIQLKLETAGEEMCTGEIEGFAVINGEVARFEKWYEQEFCGVYFKFDGKNSITVEEETNCLAYHGEDCPFAGTYKKK